MFIYSGGQGIALHTMVAHQNTLIVFGGKVSLFCTRSDLVVYHIGRCHMHDVFHRMLLHLPFFFVTDSDEWLALNNIDNNLFNLENDDFYLEEHYTAVMINQQEMIVYGTIMQKDVVARNGIMILRLHK